MPAPHGTYVAYIVELQARLDFVMRHYVPKDEDGAFTFPDGYIWRDPDR